MRTMIVATVSAATLLATSALAHHSGAMFDRSKAVTLSGVVKDWQWTNPHTALILDVAGDQGRVVEWNLEGQSPQVLRGRGWNRGVMKVGDKVVVRTNPLRDGGLGGSIVTVTTADGRSYN